MYPNLLPGPQSDEKCLSLVGMAGAGKTTLGRLVSERFGWAFLDTDLLLQAYHGLSLPQLMDQRGLEGFMAAEDELVASLGCKRCVVATGGSVIYGQKAVARLKELGWVVFLDIGFETFKARVGDFGSRGFVHPPGESLEEVFAKRRELYLKAADFRLEVEGLCEKDCLELLAGQLSGWLETLRKKDG